MKLIHVRYCSYDAKISIKLLKAWKHLQLLNIVLKYHFITVSEAILAQNISFTVWRNSFGVSILR